MCTRSGSTGLGERETCPEPADKRSRSTVIMPSYREVVAKTFRANSSRVASVVSPRSEEHTSELQSQSNLVCRLLLEKKKYCVTTLTSRSLTKSAQVKETILVCTYNIDCVSSHRSFRSIYACELHCVDMVLMTKH